MEALYQGKERGQELFLICKALQTHFKNTPIEIIDFFPINPVKKFVLRIFRANFVKDGLTGTGCLNFVLALCIAHDRFLI